MIKGKTEKENKVPEEKASFMSRSLARERSRDTRERRAKEQKRSQEGQKKKRERLTAEAKGKRKTS